MGLEGGVRDGEEKRGQQEEAKVRAEAMGMSMPMVVSCLPLAMESQ